MTSYKVNFQPIRDLNYEFNGKSNRREMPKWTKTNLYLKTRNLEGFYLLVKFIENRIKTLIGKKIFEQKLIYRTSKTFKTDKIIFLFIVDPNYRYRDRLLYEGSRSQRRQVVTHLIQNHIMPTFRAILNPGLCC